MPGNELAVYQAGARSAVGNRRNAEARLEAQRVRDNIQLRRHEGREQLQQLQQHGDVSCILFRGPGQWRTNQNPPPPGTKWDGVALGVLPDCLTAGSS